MNICRVCLNDKPGRDVTELTLKTLETDEKHSYQEILDFCLGIQITFSKNVSTKLCVNCYQKILEFYNFKALALKSDAHLRSIQMHSVVLLANTIKKEINEYSSIDSDEMCNEDEPIVAVKEECKEEYLSDDEVLSVTNNNKDNLKDDEDLDILNLNSVRRTKQVKVCIAKQSIESMKKICDVCGKAVKDLNKHRNVHIDLATKSQSKIECDLCGKKLSSKRSMLRHIKYRHLNILEKCPTCGKNVKVLYAHMKLMHTPKCLKFECHHCHRRFISKSVLVQHMLVHTKEKPFACEVCGKRFTAKIVMRNHVRQVHDQEKSHMCQFCSKQFFKKYHLQVHLRAHTKEKPYECSDCKKKFITTSTLRAHRLIHKTEKNYKCTICDNSFVSPSYLKTHMKSHIREKKYPCQFCGVRFHRSDHRKRHEFTAHLKHDRYDGAKPS